MSQVIRNYCVDCEWSASVGEYNREELAGLAIEHAVECGHDIESDIEPDR